MPKISNKKIKKSVKIDFLEQTFKNNSEWKCIYNIEDKLLDIVKKIYYGNIINRYDIYDLQSIHIQFKIFSKTYELMISRRNNDYGLSIYNIEDPHKLGNTPLNKTIKNNKFYLYNIYLIVFGVLQNN